VVAVGDRRSHQRRRDARVRQTDHVADLVGDHRLEIDLVGASVGLACGGVVEPQVEGYVGVGDPDHRHAAAGAGLPGVVVGGQGGGDAGAGAEVPRVGEQDVALSVSLGVADVGGHAAGDVDAAAVPGVHRADRGVHAIAAVVHAGHATVVDPD